MASRTKREHMLELIEQHGRNLLAIFPEATERDPVKLCKRLRRLESEAAAIGLRMSNGPEYAEGEADKATDAILGKVNRVLGNVRECQPKTGAKCGCKRGVQRDNCSACEGTGMCIDFAAIRATRGMKLVPVFVNRDARGYALKINDEWLNQQRSRADTVHKAVIHRDWGGYGIIAPDFAE